MSHLILSLVFTGSVSSLAVWTAEGCRPAAVKPWPCDHNFASRQASSAFLALDGPAGGYAYAWAIGEQPIR
jgi:hypothetical protein